MPVDDRIERVAVVSTPNNTRFLLAKKNYSQQYSMIYNQRLAKMKPNLSTAAALKWGDGIKILNKIIDSELNDENIDCHNVSECVLIGTLYKEMPSRTSVLDEFRESNGLSGGTQSSANFTSNDDKLILEDESGRIVLAGTLIDELIGLLVTGVVVALKGKESSLGTFDVSDILYYGEAQFIYSAPTPASTQYCEVTTAMQIADTVQPIVSEPIYVMLISGLEVGATNANERATRVISLQMLVDFLSGRLGGPDDVKKASRVCRVVIAGNVISASSSAFSGSDSNSSSSAAAHKKQQSDTNGQAKTLDLLLTQALGCTPLDVMPGPGDPSNITLPQQPLHPCLFRHSARFSSLSLVPNPHECILQLPAVTATAKVDERAVRVLGHSGQPTIDIRRQTRIQSKKVDQGEGGRDNNCNGNSSNDVTVDEAQEALKILERTLVWGHLCPTAPDTLACYPFTEHDPFVLNRIPDILFAGNQPAFATSLHSFTGKNGGGGNISHRTRLCSIPVFAATHQAVLVNVNSPDLDCSIISFEVALP